MFTIQEYLDSLKNDKQTLITNLTTKGITCSSDETFTTLVPKVLDIVGVNNQSKSETITTNTTITITPDTGYTGLSSVEITTNVQSDMSIYFANTIPNYFSPTALIKKFPTGTYNINSNTDLSQWFLRYWNLETAPDMNTSSVTNMSQMFSMCNSLTDVPIYNTTSVTNFTNMFLNCVSLSNTSLDNILQMCIGATSYNGTKTLTQLGFNSTNYPSATIQALPHYNDFLTAGWTIGY